MIYVHAIFIGRCNCELVNPRNTDRNFRLFPLASFMQPLSLLCPLLRDIQTSLGLVCHHKSTHLIDLGHLRINDPPFLPIAPSASLLPPLYSLNGLTPQWDSPSWAFWSRLSSFCSSLTVILYLQLNALGIYRQVPWFPMLRCKLLETAVNL